MALPYPETVVLHFHWNFHGTFMLDYHRQILRSTTSPQVVLFHCDEATLRPKAPPWKTVGPQ